MKDEFSTELIDIIKPAIWPVAKWPHTGGPIAALVSMKLLCQVVMQIGWHEHTNDWNPELLFTLKDGSTVSTMNTVIEIPGYDENIVYDLDFNPEEIYVEIGLDDVGNEPITKKILIEDIKTVEFFG